MALFGRTTIDDPDLRQLAGRRRVLASARGPRGQVLGLADALVWSDGGTCHELGWHDIERGGWDRESATLRWTTADGRETTLPLTETGMLPDLFNERVTASIACVRNVELSGSGIAVISARRNLADNRASLLWRVTPGRGVSAEQVAADPSVALELNRLRAEYDLS
nr:hypothetical protein [Propionicimonas sp.]